MIGAPYWQAGYGAGSIKVEEHCELRGQFEARIFLRRILVSVINAATPVWVKQLSSKPISLAAFVGLWLLGRHRIGQRL
jgi:hypothetical protein